MLQFVLLPLQLISGIYFASSQLPAWLQHVADAFPLAHLTDALQHAWLPSGATIAWGDLAIMAQWGAAAALLAAPPLPLASRGIAARGTGYGAPVRTFTLVLALAFIAILGFLTLYVLVSSGPDVLVVVSLIVLGLFAFGIIGALATPPRDEG